MHNNYYFLRQLTQQLNKLLQGYSIATCYSQNKDELLIGFTNGESDFYIKASLTPHFSALSFPTQAHRARANSVELFQPMLGEQVQEVIQHQNERSFQINLSNEKILLFKLFGNRSNILLFHQQEPMAIFHKKFAKDLELRPDQMSRSLSTDFETFLTKKGKISAVYPTFGDLPEKYLHLQGFTEANPEKQWQLIQEVVKELENPKAFYLIRLEQKLRLSLLPIGEIAAEFSEPVAALDQFVRQFLREQAFTQTYQQAQQILQKKLQQTEASLEQASARLQALQHGHSYSQTADLIMANLTNIPPQASEVELFDFYSNQNRVIKLKSSETPQKTAEKLYKKSKNQQIEVRQLENRISEKEEELLQLMEAQEQLPQQTELKQLRAFVKQHELVPTTRAAITESLFREFRYQGFTILVGKSAANNDVLTQKHTYKEDLWLHAKDVSGSHVVIKYQSGKNFPENVIEKAAQLAAWYSKRKQDSLCPVLYTPKKFVRKPKGAAPGAVFVEREKVMLVKPENPFETSP